MWKYTRRSVLPHTVIHLILLIFASPAFSVDEVFDALENLDTSKSPGPDDILPISLKTCSNELVPALWKVFNHFIQKGQVPKAWKEANTVPVYKGGVKPKDDVGSYRPVSLTSILCKVLEKLIFVHILRYAHEHDILSDNQFGFRNGRNCEQMIVKFFTMFVNPLMIGNVILLTTSS